jgi:hypothetical protein
VADKVVPAPHGQIVITVALSSIISGNKAVEDAKKAAELQASAQGRTLTGEWGSEVQGSNILIKFPLRAASEEIDTGGGEPLLI